MKKYLHKNENVSISVPLSNGSSQFIVQWIWLLYVETLKKYTKYMSDKPNIYTVIPPSLGYL